jgi:hypothetical protein
VLKSFIDSLELHHLNPDWRTWYAAGIRLRRINGSAENGVVSLSERRSWNAEFIIAPLSEEALFF